MKKKKIFIWQSGEPLPIDRDNHNPMRAINLSEFLVNKGYDVTLISANFNHTKKIFREENINKYKILDIDENFKIVLINSIGYKKNISLKRLIDHLQLSYNLKEYLDKQQELPDLGFIGFPPIEPSIVLSNWLYKKKIPFLFDIKDLWPEYFYERLENKFISFLVRIVFLLHDFFLKRSLKKSNAIVSNNNFFLEFILNKIKKKKREFDKVIYLTKPILDKNNINLNQKFKFDKDTFKLYFCGRINMEVFDFITVFDSLKILDKENFNFHFYLAGYGELEYLKKKVLLNSIEKKVSFIGYVNKFEHSNLLINSDAFIAPFFNKLNFSSNLSNKFIEAIQYQLPLITPLQKDVADFIKYHNIGLIYNERDSKDLAIKIKKLIISKNNNENIYIKNLSKLSSDEFNHENNYKKFIKIFENIKK